MATIVQKLTISLQPDILKTIDRLQKKFKFKSRSSVIDYLVRAQEKQAFYAEVHRQALQSAAFDGEKSSQFASMASMNTSTHILEDDGEDYSTW